MSGRLPLQIAFLTGQSDPSGSALSPEQERFLDALPGGPEGKVRLNFPYPEEARPRRPHREVPLLPASWNNYSQYLASRRPEFAARHRPAVSRLLARAETTLFLAGSCGLELLVNLDLPAGELAGVRVFAYGASARRRPACALRTVHARWDWVALLGARGRLGPPDFRVGGGHLGYLRNPKVLELASAYVEEIRRSPRREETSSLRAGGAP